MNWYYEKNEEAKGPMSLEELLPHITAETLVWAENSLENWVAASEHPNLAAIFKSKIKEENTPIINKANEEGEKSLLIKSNDKLVDNNLELLKKTELQNELNKKLEEEHKVNDEKLKQLEREKILLQEKLNSTNAQKEEEIKKLNAEKQLLKNKYSESTEKAQELSSKVGEYEQKLDANNNKQLLDTYIASKLNDGYVVVNKVDESFTVELLKKEGKVLPRKKMKFGLVKLLLLFTCIGLLEGYFYNKSQHWYRFERQKPYECEECVTQEDRDKALEAYDDYEADYLERESEWYSEHGNDARNNFIVFISFTTILSVLVWRIMLFINNRKPLVKLDIKANTSVVNGSIKEKITEI